MSFKTYCGFNLIEMQYLTPEDREKIKKWHNKKEEEKSKQYSQQIRGPR